MIGTPQLAGRTSMHKLAPTETAALAGKIANACAAMEGPVRVLLTYEAGYEGFWLARWLGGLATLRIDVVVCDPASLEVTRRAKSAKTSLINASSAQVRQPRSSIHVSSQCRIRSFSTVFGDPESGFPQLVHIRTAVWTSGNGPAARARPAD